MCRGDLKSRFVIQNHLSSFNTNVKLNRETISKLEKIRIIHALQGCPRGRI